jgi:TPR repeat protein
MLHHHNPPQSRAPCSKIVCLTLVLALAAAPAAWGQTDDQSDAQTATPFDTTTLQARAQNGDSDAAFKLATLDYVGLGVVQDYIGAINLAKQGAAAGNQEAACLAGFLYQTGSFGQGPPPPDFADALPYYQKSAAAGNACGEFGLATMLQAGSGVPKDLKKAAALYAQAAAQGFALDPNSFPLQQLQERFYAAAYQVTGQNQWTDMVSRAAGGQQ